MGRAWIKTCSSDLTVKLSARCEFLSPRNDNTHLSDILPSHSVCRVFDVKMHLVSRIGSEDGCRVTKTGLLGSGMHNRDAINEYAEG